MGSGKQLISWITIDDLIYNLYRFLIDSTFRGAVNVVAPQPITNEVFVKALAHQLKRPLLLPLPAFLIKLIFGEMAEGTILSNAGSFLLR